MVRSQIITNLAFVYVCEHMFWQKQKYAWKSTLQIKLKGCLYPIIFDIILIR